MSVAYRDPQLVLHDVHAALDAYGCKPKQIRGDAFTACCPAHDDSSPSLSVKTGERGIVLHCFAGCDTTSVLNAIGLDYGDVFYETKRAEPDPIRPRPAAPAPAPASVAAPARLQGSYVDKDLRDALLNDTELVTQLEHERRITPTTLQLVGCGRAPDGRIIIPTFDRDGHQAPRHWAALAEQRAPGKPKIIGPKNAKPDLWPRPETPRYADNTSILIVEGEPDALVAITQGIQVVGLPGVNTWRNDDAARFARFSHVTVLLDDDEAGREASRIISRDLAKVGISVTERRHTPGEPTRRDLTDLAREEIDLAAAIEQLPIIKPDTLFNRALHGVDINAMLDTEPAEREWIWDDYLCRGTLNMIHGAAGLGKSMIGLGIAAACTRSIPSDVLGHIVQPCRVTIIDAENSEDEIHRRLRLAGIEQRDRLAYYRTSLVILGTDETKSLFDEISRHSDLVILDSQRGLWDGDEKEQAEAGRMLRDLARIAEATGLCILEIHHDTKAGSYSGSSDIDAAVSGSRLHIERAHDPRKRDSLDDDEKWKERRLTHAKCRIGQEQRPVNFKISVDEQIWLQPVTGPTSELDNQCARIYAWAKTHPQWPRVPIEDVKEHAGFDAGDDERNGWRPLGQHLRNNKWARAYNRRNSRVIEFVEDLSV